MNCFVLPGWCIIFFIKYMHKFSLGFHIKVFHIWEHLLNVFLMLDTFSMNWLTDEFYQPIVLLFCIFYHHLLLHLASFITIFEALQYPSWAKGLILTLSSLNVLPVICHLFCRTLLGLFSTQRSLFVINARKWPASSDFARAIASDAIGLLVTLSNFIDLHVIWTALLLPHRNTIWTPWDAPLGKLAWVACL